MTASSGNRYISDELPGLLERFEIDLVLDVGANAGQFAHELLQAGFGADIISFEPLSEAHARLVSAARDEPNWTVSPRCALGDTSGVGRINIAGNSQSSSMLPMLASHESAAPASRYVGTEVVELRRLDELVTADYLAGRRGFLKIDAQGYESRVVSGAAGVIPALVGVQLEMDLEALYDGADLVGDLLPRMRDLGFAPYALRPGFRDLSDGRLLQVDGVFFRPGFGA